MSLKSLHILLTYQCNYECDHCFVWGGPQQTGVFTSAQLEDIFQQALEQGDISGFYFEGGEAFLYYPILLKAVARATELGFSTGIVSNGYWATDVDDARVWLQPLAEAGLGSISFSDDILHGEAAESEETHLGVAAAHQLGLQSGRITLELPVAPRDSAEYEPGSNVISGGIMFRGRAAVKLIEGLPRQPWHTFTTCPYENLTDPSRVHPDPLGNLHLCQGLVIGNLFQQPLKQIIKQYNPETHPIINALLAGGPAELVRRYNLNHAPDYVDACHLCYNARLALRSRFPDALAPDQIYGE